MRTGLIITLSLCLLGAAIGQQQTEETAQAQQTEQQTQQQATNAWLRFTHGFSTSGPVDVYIDNLPTPSWNWIPFRQVTAYKPIMAGQHSITLVRANATRMGEEMEQQTGEQSQTEEGDQIQQRQTEQTQQTEQQTEGQQTEGQQPSGQELRPLSEFFSSDDILLEANFNIQDSTFYSFAWFGEQEQMQTEQMQQTEQTEQTEQEQQTQETQAKQQTEAPEGQQGQQGEGLVQSTNSWALYIDRLETAEGQVRFRWIHLVPEFPQISIFLEQVGGSQKRQQQEQLFAENLNFLSASPYSTVQPGTYNIIIRSAQPQQQQTDQQQQTGQQEQTEQQTDQQQQTEQQTDQQQQTEQQTDQQQQTEQQQTEQTEQQQQNQQGEEIRRIERVQLLAGNVYTGWVLGPLESEQQQQEQSDIAAIIKFDNFELLMMGQQQASQ